ncbi:DUF3160 domain-containing protein [Methanosarcina sp. Mfa9]|uniref:DUF3160 domain-containing protein n=1 Tax=Methanosarcina sp. Mfa9 TaxID=3439063 RepID=UPI003F8312E3
MNRRIKTIVICIIVSVSIFVGGCLEESGGRNENSATGHLKTEAVSFSGSGAGNFPLTENYHLEALDIELKVPPYELPLEEADISNYENFSGKIQLDAQALEKLKTNGFVVIKNPYNSGEEDITGMYSILKKEEVPIFITTDSLLHLYHIQFDETLRQIEEQEFYGLLWEIDRDLLNASVAEYNNASSSEEVKEAARRNAAYFSVALSLLQPKPEQVRKADELFSFEYDDSLFPAGAEGRYQFEVPGFVKEEVASELALIEGHAGFASSPIFLYQEDYSQYVPRGHYTRSEMLKNYFRTFMWHGRMSMLLKGELIRAEDPEKEARIQTMQASLIASELESEPELFGNWERIYLVTAFYVGFSDDLGPYEYIEALDTVFAGDFEPGKLNEVSVAEMKAKLAEFQGPEIYGGTGNCTIPPPYSPEQADECLNDTRGFRFMGQRLIPDSYMFSSLVGAYTGEYRKDTGQPPFTLVISEAGRPIRGFPRGLDVMALLGSERAVYWLDELDDSDYEDYSARYAELNAEFSSFNGSDWNRNLYWAWLYSLRPLLKNHGEGYPTFMQTESWQDKELATSLASWTELRHNTILYAKQSYIMRSTAAPPRPEEKKPVVGYVEPVPEFYARLLALTRMTNQGLDEMGVLDSASRNRLTNLESVLERLLKISEKELENEELTESDYEFIKTFGDQLEGVISDVDEKARKTTIVADVHTEGNTGMVLEEGVGYVDMMVVAYKLPDGRILVGAGPVMSHYEFKQPMDDRLTDEKWREMLEENPPERPEWTSTYIS